MQTDNLEIVLTHIAGVDIHKMKITATERLRQPGADWLVETGEFSALPDGLEELVRWLGDFGVTATVMEATGVYWRAPLRTLEDTGIEARLVHAQKVRQLRGRKTDRNNSRWHSRVCQLGLASGQLRAAAAVPRTAPPELPPAQDGGRAQPCAQSHPEGA